MNNIETVKQVVAEVFQTEASQLDEATILQDLDSWDSMLHMVFVTQLEKTSGVRFSGKEIARMKSIGDITGILSDHQEVAS